MKASTTRKAQLARALAVPVVLSFALAACATLPESPMGAAEARSKLTALQSDPNLASRARVEVGEAELAVRVAEEPLREDAAALGAHRVYMADHAIEIARAKATTRYAEDQRGPLSEARAEARLDARTREADGAHVAAARARGDAERARVDAQHQQKELQLQIDALEARTTERGLIVTLGDVLFATGRSDLHRGSENLARLVTFLNQYPDRQVMIEGHTDNIGMAAYNRDLSQRRADSVRSYLVRQGIASQRLSTSAIGMDRPVANNGSAAGRQRNRRVEIIIENPKRTSGAVGLRR